MTTDSLQLFPQRAGPEIRCHRRGGGRAREAIERGTSREGTMVNEPPPRRVDRREVPGHGWPLIDLIQEGIIRAHPRRRGKLELAPRISSSRVRDVVIRRRCRRRGEHARTIRIPVHIVEREQKIERAEREVHPAARGARRMRRSPRRPEAEPKQRQGGARGGTHRGKPRKASGDDSAHRLRRSRTRTARSR